MTDFPNDLLFAYEESQERVVYAIDLLKGACHETAKDKGWWETERSLPEQVALMHSELSEALECYREFHLADFNDPETGKPEGITSEFADTLIRIFDTCARYNLPLGPVLLAKMSYNRTRPYRHGGKLA